VKKIAKKQATKQIGKLAPGLSVAHADTADSADTAQSAETAANADAVGGQPLGSIAIARSDPTTGGQCDPTSSTFVLCADVTVDLPHAGRVLLIGTAGQYAFNASTTQGDCRLQTDGATIGGSIVSVGNQTAPDISGVDNRNFADGFSTTVVTAPLDAGPHTFAMQCNEDDADIEFESPQLSAALFGSG